MLLKNIEALSSQGAERFFEGECSWWRFTDVYKKAFKAHFIKSLRQQECLVDKNNNLRKPCDITFSELSDNYIKESPNINILIKALEFKPDIIEQLPEEYRNKLELIKDLSIQDLEKLLAEQKNKEPFKPAERISDWNPEYKPGEVDVKFGDIEPEKIVTLDLKGQSEQLEKGNGEEPTSEKTIAKDVVETLSHADSKKIGGWGKEHVYHALMKTYEEIGSVIETDFGFKVNRDNEEFEIVWLNKHRNVGKDYDFVIKKNSIEIEYIEVKTKVQEAKELIEITGTQWEFARKLHEQDEGEKYLLYVVINARKSNAGIKRLRNPINLWKDGKLYAHPINFKV